MKHLILFVLLSLVLDKAMASDADLFEYDRKSVVASMQDLSNLEGYLIENPSRDLPSLRSDQELNARFNLSLLDGEPKEGFSLGTMDWGSFAWGFCCWQIGIFTVLLDESKDENSLISFGAGFLAHQVASVVVSSVVMVIWVGLNLAYL